MLKKLIINADDFGWDEETTTATIAAFETGSLTSATIMTGRSATEMACDYARRNYHRFSFGLHFNIVDGHEPSCSKTTSLQNKLGLFRTSKEQRIAGVIGRIKSDEVYSELNTQVKILKKYGVSPTHIDSHGHLHKIPAILRGVTMAAKECGIKKIRRAQNLYITPPTLFSRLANNFCKSNNSEIITTDWFVTLTTYENWAEKIGACVLHGTTELSVHPGKNDFWRTQELIPFLDGTLPEALKKHKITLTNYSKL